MAPPHPLTHRSRVRTAGGDRVVTLPEALCNELGIVPGVVLSFERHGNAAILIGLTQRPHRRIRPRRPIKEVLAQGGSTRMAEDDPYLDSPPVEGELI